MAKVGNIGLTATVPVALALPAAANDFTTYIYRYWTLSAKMEAHRMDLYRAYSDCSKTAKERVISVSEAEACADLYLRLKLTFLPGANTDRFRTLSAGGEGGGCRLRRRVRALARVSSELCDVG